MPFVVDRYPQAVRTDAVAGLALALGGRKGKGWHRKRQYEKLEALSRFTLPLHVTVWESAPEGCTGLLVDPQGFISGAVRFDLSPEGPGEFLNGDLGEDEFVALCQNLARAAIDYSATTLEITGLVSEGDSLQILLNAAGEPLPDAGLERNVEAARVADALRGKQADYRAALAAWSELKQEILANRDRFAAKIKEASAEAREAGSRAQAELESQVKAAIATRRQEIEADREQLRRDQLKEVEMLQSELSRFRQQYRTTGENYWREKIAAEEQRLADNEKRIAAQMEQYTRDERRFAQNQEEKIKQFTVAGEKRLAVYEQRLNILNAAVSGLEKQMEQRIERLRMQPQKIDGLMIRVSPEQCGRDVPLVFYAARYEGGRWVVFSPRQIGRQGIGGMLSTLTGGSSLPFRPATKTGEAIAARLQAMLPGHPLEERLIRQNLLEDPQFINETRTGLAELIDQGELGRKFRHLFDHIRMTGPPDGS